MKVSEILEIRDMWLDLTAHLALGYRGPLPDNCMDDFNWRVDKIEEDIKRILRESSKLTKRGLNALDELYACQRLLLNRQEELSRYERTEL